MSKRDPRGKMLRTCRGCGCDDDHACISYGGPCFWVVMDLPWPTGVCSACAIEFHYDREIIAYVGLDRDGLPLVLQQPGLLRASG